MAATVQTNHADTPREALAAFKKGHFDQVIRQLETLAPDQDPPRELLKIGVESYLKLGRPETAFKSYLKLIPSGQPDDARLLREIATAFVTSHVRNMYGSPPTPPSKMAQNRR